MNREGLNEVKKHDMKPEREKLKAAAKRLFRPGGLPALIRFPPGEGPLCRGLGHWK
jgi:hypothetical protein